MPSSGNHVKNITAATGFRRRRVELSGGYGIFGQSESTRFRVGSVNNEEAYE